MLTTLPLNDFYLVLSNITFSKIVQILSKSCKKAQKTAQNCKI